MISYSEQLAVEPAGRLRLVDRLCDEFESGWRSGQRPSLHSFLNRTPAELRPGIFRELLALDVDYRRQLGEQPSAVEYLQEFEEFSHEIESRFAQHASEIAGQQSDGGPSAWPRIPGYEIERVLGRGGMGVVYLAHQLALKRPVALKMLRSGAEANNEERGRFRREVEAAASLHHPNIVQIFEVGEFEGQPYCVLEYIPGESLRELVRRGPQPAAVAAELVAVLANAVDHAHQRGFIHRDLKPANILLEGVHETVPGSQPAVSGADTEIERGSAPTNVSNARNPAQGTNQQDGLMACGAEAVPSSGLRPKVSDFGLARRVESVDTMQTQSGTVLGTPAYMAPEQAAGRSKDVGPATDVYSLGAVLYELLTGRPPHQAAELVETLDLIRHQEPVPPRVLLPLVPRDLNTICLKCLAKEVGRRYTTAAELARDLRRFLDGQPIHARPTGPIERVSKWVRRNPAIATLSAAIVLIAVTAFATVYSRLLAERRARNDANLAREAEAGQRVVAHQEKTKAETEAAVALAISQFLRKDLLEQASPRSGPDRNILLRTVLDRASERVNGQFPEQPLVEAAIRMTLATTYDDLGLAKEAQPHLERAHELRAKALGPEHRETLVAAVSLATIYKSQGRYAEAQSLFEQSVEGMRHAAGEEHPDTLAAMNNLAELYSTQGRHEEAEREHKETLRLRRRVLGPDHPSTLVSMNNLSELYAGLARHEEAAELAEQVLQARRRVLGDEHPETLSSMNAHAARLRLQGRLDEAAALYERTIETRKRVLGTDHPHTLNSMNNLAGLESDRGNRKQAELFYRSVLDSRRRLLGEEHPDTLVSMNNLADLYGSQRRYAEAEPLLRHAVDVQRRLQGDENPRTLIYLNNQAMNLQKLGRYEEAEPIHRQVLEAQRLVMGSDNPTTLTALNNLALCCKAQRRYDEAESLFKELLEARRRKFGDRHSQTLSSMNSLARIYETQGKHSEAKALKAEFSQ